MKSAQLSSLAPNSEVWLKRRARNPSAASDVREAMRQPKKIRGWPCHANESKTGTSRSRTTLSRFGRWNMETMCGKAFQNPSANSDTQDQTSQLQSNLSD